MPERRTPDAPSSLAEHLVEGLAAWSEWLPFQDVLTVAPRQPGVYMAREGSDGEIVYVGMAGERNGHGLRGRLGVYASGKAAVSGLGEAVMDRALADADWIRERLAEVEAGAPSRTKLWAKAAIAHADLHVRWATTPDRASALVLEKRVIDALAGGSLWNRAASRLGPTLQPF